MTVSRISWLVVVLVLTAVAPGNGARAQSDSNEPLFIIPTGDFDGAASAATAPLSSEPPEVEVEDLSPPGAGAAGLLDSANGGLPADMWRGADARMVEGLMPKIPAASGSAAMNRLARRLLLSVAVPPAGVDPARFMGYRVDRLIALGQGPEVEALLRGTGEMAKSPEILGARINQLFLDGDVQKACPLVREIVREDATDYWQKAMIFCQRLDGQQTQADLGMSLLADQGAEIGATFLTLNRALAGEPGVTLNSFSDADPLLLAMALQAGVALPADTAETDDPAVLAALARNPEVALETRLAAAERAVAQAVLDAETLAAIYGQVEFTAEQRSNALSEAQRIGGPKGRALLFQAAQGQPTATARAEVYRNLMLDAANEGGTVGYAVAARAIHDQLAAMQPSPEVAWFAPDIVTALLVAGDPEAAARWWPQMQERARVDPSSAAQVQALWPMMRLAFGDQIADNGRQMEVWWNGFDPDQESERRARGAVYAALMTGLNDAAVDPLLPYLVVGPQLVGDGVPPSVLIDAMLRAADEEKIGQTVLLSLVTLGEGGTAEADPVTLGAVVQALHRIGLGQDARLIALEAAFAGGA
jgi:hypothetical protein